MPLRIHPTQIAQDAETACYRYGPTPVAEGSGTGWALDWRCGTCGQPVDLLLRQTGPGERSGLHFRTSAGVRAAEGTLALIREGKDAVPAWRRTGRPVPVMSPPAESTRPVLERRLAERRAALAR